MPQYVEVNGQNIEFPDGMPPAEIEAAIKKNAMSISPSRTGGATGSFEQEGGATGSWAPSISRGDQFAKGLKDPFDGAAQLLTKILPRGAVKAIDSANNWLADKTGLVSRLPAGGLDQQLREDEGAYQAGRQEAGSTGFDFARVAGNVVSPANVYIGSRMPQAANFVGRLGAGALGGATSGALTAVTTGDDFAAEKAKQVGLGALFGGGTSAVTGGISRLISPNASKNANVQLLKNEGVTPTVGQALGGRWNAAEEKLTSIPVLGDMISRARGGALEEFNNAAINRASGKVGTQVQGVGQDAVREAGDAISDSYEKALSSIKFVKFDKQFAQDAGQLQSMAQSLAGPLRSKFTNKMQEVVGDRISGTGSMLPGTYKKADSELGQLVARYSKSSVASEQELGDAFAQLQSLLKQQMIRSNPQVASGLKAADAGWANLVRVENAAGAAKNAEGMFTPAQLNQAVRATDGSVRKRATARGEALLQDLANAGQQVLGNKVPNSGTTDRALLGAGALGGGFLLDPIIGASLLGSGLLYTKPGQFLLSNAVTSRPALAEPVANALRKSSPGLVPFGAQVGLGLLNNP